MLDRPPSFELVTASQSVLTAPRVYFGPAGDGLFIRAVASINPKTHVPALAIILQSILTPIIALSGSYEKILSYVVSMDFIFFGLMGGYRVPGHLYTTGLFVSHAGWW
jgi:APA family basic amino acid/polyamine antiporter